MSLNIFYANSLAFRVTGICETKEVLLYTLSQAVEVLAAKD